MKDGEEEIVYAVDYNHKKERQGQRDREREREWKSLLLFLFFTDILMEQYLTISPDHTYSSLMPTMHSASKQGERRGTRRC